MTTGQQLAQDYMDKTPDDGGAAGPVNPRTGRPLGNAQTQIQVGKGGYRARVAQGPGASSTRDTTPPGVMGRTNDEFFAEARANRENPQPAFKPSSLASNSVGTVLAREQSPGKTYMPTPNNGSLVIPEKYRTPGTDGIARVGSVSGSAATAGRIVDNGRDVTQKFAQSPRISPSVTPSAVAATGKPWLDNMMKKAKAAPSLIPRSRVQTAQVRKPWLMGS